MSYWKWLYLGVMLLIISGTPVFASDWDVAVLDGATGDAGKFTSLRIDSFDLPHIAYQVENPDSLKYTWLQGDTWLYEVPANAEGMGMFTSMVLEENDSAHIAHHDPVEADLMHTWRINGSTLDTESVDTAGPVGMYCAIDLDSEENPVISYNDGNDNSIRLARLQPGGWIQAIEFGIDPSFTDVSVGPMDVIHVVYSDYNTSSLKYARNDGTWNIETVDTGITGIDGSLVLDAAGLPHVVYVDTNTANINYAYHDGVSWIVETAFEDATAMTNCIDFVLDSNDVPHLCFYSKVETLVYANRIGGTWQGDGVDDDGNVGHFCSMDIDSTDRLHIAYYDADLKNLKYAVQTLPPTPTPTPMDLTSDLTMNDDYFTAGETFLLERTWINAMGAPQAVDEYIILDVAGLFWFWPSWSDTGDFSKWTVPVGGPTTDTILTFTWPQVSGEFTGIRFWSGFLAADTVDLLSYDMIEWGYGETPPPLTLTSTAFANGASIPAKYTCDGTDVSPPLTWNRPSQQVQSFAIIMDDPDAPGGDWVHWVLYNIPPETLSLAEAIPADPELTDGSRHGKNSWDEYGYGGPCPPSGTHRYFFKLYALDTPPGLPVGATKAELLSAMDGHILYQTELMGTYQR